VLPPFREIIYVPFAKLDKSILFVGEFNCWDKTFLPTESVITIRPTPLTKRISFEGLGYYGDYRFCWDKTFLPTESVITIIP